MAKFEIFKDAKSEFRFHLKADNGEKILSSESYKDLGGARNGVASVKSNAAMDERYDRKESKDGKHYFNLKAGNHEIIGTSEMYSSASSRDDGIEDVKRLTPGAQVVDID